MAELRTGLTVEHLTEATFKLASAVAELQLAMTYKHLHGMCRETWEELMDVFEMVEVGFAEERERPA